MSNIYVNSVEMIGRFEYISRGLSSTGHHSHLPTVHWSCNSQSISVPGKIQQPHHEQVFGIGLPPDNRFPLLWSYTWSKFIFKPSLISCTGPGITVSLIFSRTTFLNRDISSRRTTNAGLASALPTLIANGFQLCVQPSAPELLHQDKGKQQENGDCGTMIFWSVIKLLPLQIFIVRKDSTRNK